MKLRPALFVALLAPAFFARAAETPPAAPPELPAPKLAGYLPEDPIPESSGLVKSPKHAGVFWTHNDSGDTARVFAVDAKAKLLRTVDIPGAKNVDWEDLAFDEQGRLVAADIGDNARKHAACTLFRFPEPDPAQPDEKVAPAKVQTYRFTYPKEVGQQDAEGLIVRAGYAYVFTKEAETTRCLRVPLPEDPPKDAVVAEFVAQTQAITIVTAADLSPDGKHLALLTYMMILTIELPEPLEKTVKVGDAKALPQPFAGKIRKRPIFLGQAEGLAWNGDDLLISCEQGPKSLIKGGGLWRIEKAK